MTISVHRTTYVRSKAGQESIPTVGGTITDDSKSPIRHHFLATKCFPIEVEIGQRKKVLFCRAVGPFLPMNLYPEFRDFFGPFPHLPRRSPPRSELEPEVPLGPEALRALVVGVRHDDPARGHDGHALRVGELGPPAAAAAHLQHQVVLHRVQAGTLQGERKIHRMVVSAASAATLAIVAGATESIKAAATTAAATAIGVGVKGIAVTQKVNFKMYPLT